MQLKVGVSDEDVEVTARVVSNAFGESIGSLESVVDG
jgi:hypothetical protein